MCAYDSVVNENIKKCIVHIPVYSKIEYNIVQLKLMATIRHWLCEVNRLFIALSTTLSFPPLFLSL